MDINSFVIGYKKGKASVPTGGGSLEGFHMVRFFNDDQTTLLYTVYVPTGASAMYAGETPVSTVDDVYMFSGFEPTAVNVTADLDCYATYETFASLDEASWEQISILSEKGVAENYFAVGDTKMIRVSGQIGTLFVDSDYGVYIIGFDHNEELEGKGIHFGTFKDAVSAGKDICLVDGSYYSDNSNGAKYFNMHHWGDANYGGWAGCDMRYDILGSTDAAPLGYGAEAMTDRVGYDPSTAWATIPVAKTLMAALPSDLRAVMKPMTKYTDNVGGGVATQERITVTTDYLPLLADFEIAGKISHGNTYEQYKQKQYDYYVAGNSAQKYSHLSPSTEAKWWERSPRGNGSGLFCAVSGKYCTSFYADKVLGLAPIFKV